MHGCLRWFRRFWRFWRFWRAGALGAALIAACLGVLAAGSAPSRGAQPTRVAVASGCASGFSDYEYSLSGGAKLISEVDVPLCVTGQVTVTFAGDRATGCAAAGLCAYSGTETFKPAGIGDLGLATVVQSGRRSTSATLSVGGFGTPVLSSVARGAGQTPAPTCRDRAPLDGDLLALPVQRGRVNVGFGDGLGAGDQIFGTRCAGPLTRDLAAALPHRTVTLAQLRHGRLTVDLSGSAPFAADGFSGTVDSTVALALGRPQTESDHVTAPLGGHRTRYVSVRYAVTRLSGAATASVRASGPDAPCQTLDACTLDGTITVAPRPGAGGSVYLYANSTRPKSERDLLTALGVDSGGDPSGISVDGAGERVAPGAVTAALSQDGSTCRNRVALGQMDILVRVRAGRLVVSVAPADSQAADPLRTRCPGPALGQHTFSSATLPIRILRQRTFTVALHGGAFCNGPYEVRVRSALSLTLARRQVSSQVLAFRAG